MAGKQRSATSPPSVNTKGFQLDVVKAIDNIGWFLDRNRFYLPVTLPSASSLPADVALWLIELRHKSDSSDLVPPKPILGHEPVWCSDDEGQAEQLSQPEDSGSDDLGLGTHFRELCMDVHSSDDTILNLDLHRKKNCHPAKIYDENDLFQVWEGLKIPRQSLCSSFRFPNVNSSCEVLSQDSDTGSRSCAENPRSHSFWEVNPMYSKGSLKDTIESVDLTPGKISSNFRCEDCRQGTGNWHSNYSDSREVINDISCSAILREKVASIEASNTEIPKSNRTDSPENWRLTNITEETGDDTVVILNYENNYGFDIKCTDDHKQLGDKGDNRADLIANPSRGGDNSCMNLMEHCQTESNSTAYQSTQQNSPLKLKCVNILNNLDEMIQTFEHIQQRVFSNSDDSRNSGICIKDHEFDHMCERAEHIIEETLKCHTDARKVAAKALKNPQLTNLERTSSDMSDEVFLNPVVERDASLSPVFTNESIQRAQRHNSLDVNEIFDDGSKTNPPVPPMRKKKVQEKLYTNFSLNKPEVEGVDRNLATDKNSEIQNKKHSYQNTSLYENKEKTFEKPELKINKASEEKNSQTCVKVKDSAGAEINLKLKEKPKENVKTAYISKETEGNLTENPNQREFYEKDARNTKESTKICNSNSVAINLNNSNHDLNKVIADNGKVLGENYAGRDKITDRVQSATVNDKRSSKEESGKHRTELTVNIEDGALSSTKLVLKNRTLMGTLNDERLIEKQKDSTVDEKKETPNKNPTGMGDQNLPDECYSSIDSTDCLSFDPKIHLTQTRPISFSTFPPSNPVLEHPCIPSFTSIPRQNMSLLKDQQKQPITGVTSADIFNRTHSFVGRPISFHTFSKTPTVSNNSTLPDTDTSTTLLKYTSTTDGNSISSQSKTSSPCGTPRASRAQSNDSPRPMSSRKSMDTTSLDESLERTRKGSNASDIAAWKLRLQMATSYYHDEEMDPNSMLSNEWFSSNDTDSGVLNEESSKDNSWMLPNINVSTCTKPPPVVKPTQSDSSQEDPRTEKLSVANIASLIEAELRGSQHGPYRVKKAKSLVIVYPKGSHDEKGVITSKQGANWTEQWDEHTRVIKESLMHRTKITEYGKKVRKNWMASYGVLTENFLMLFKDSKTFQSSKTSPEKFNPELVVDLTGSVIEVDDKLSSRKNVLVLSESSGLQFLIQLPSSSAAEQWFHLIHTATTLLGTPDQCLRLPSRECSPSCQETVLPDESVMKSPKMSRSKSVKLVNKDLESNEDLSASLEERQTKNKARLKKFFIRRPTKESLVKKGIYKDEPMFGRNLCDVVADCVPCVPRFVTQCIRVIESKEENMKADGLYRASGNLSQVQKIRLQADQNQLFALEQEEDVHVLTGALKLFFRELKKPLIPCDLFHKAILASSIRHNRERIQHFRQLVQALPTPNHDTLDFLLQHLLRVNQNKEFNRMHIPNIAIVFGPTLMWPEEESLNMALDLMKQNLVIERLLVEYHEIFR